MKHFTRLSINTFRITPNLNAARRIGFANHMAAGTEAYLAQYRKDGIAIRASNLNDGA